MPNVILPGRGPFIIPGPVSWIPYTPVLTAVTTNPTLGTGGIAQASYAIVDGLVVYRVYFQFGTSGADPGSGGYRVSAPVNISADVPSSNAVGMGSGLAFDWSVAGSRRWFQFSRVANDQFQLNMEDAQVSHNAPWTWAADDRFGGTAIYQEA